MSRNLIVRFWKCIESHSWRELADFFTSSASIHWEHTNEVFTVEAYIEVLEAHPNDWHIEITRIEEFDYGLITAIRVSSANLQPCYHIVSFFEVENGKIQTIHEYWGSIKEPPPWRISLSANKG